METAKQQVNMEVSSCMYKRKEKALSLVITHQFVHIKLQIWTIPIISNGPQ